MFKIIKHAPAGRRPAIKRQRLSEWLKHKSNIHAVYKTIHLKYKDIYRLKVKGQRYAMIIINQKSESSSINF